MFFRSTVVREALSQAAESRARQAMTGRMLCMAGLTVGQLGLYAAAPVHAVTRRRARGGRIPRCARDDAEALDRSSRGNASHARPLGADRKSTRLNSSH